MRTERGWIFRAVTITTAIVVGSLGLMGSGCGLKRRHRCTVTATYEGKVRTGRGTDFDSEQVAKSVAVLDLCRDYCTMEDPGVEAAYQKSRTGPPSADKTDERLKRLSAVDTPPVRSIFEACKAKCDAAMATTPVTPVCEHSGI